MTHYTKGTLSGRKDPPTDCRRSVSGTVSLPSSGCFSPFPHGTGSLSVSKEYLAFEGGPPIFRQNFTCSALLNTSDHASHTGLSPTMACLSKQFWSQVFDKSDTKPGEDVVVHHEDKLHILVFCDLFSKLLSLLSGFPDCLVY